MNDADARPLRELLARNLAAAGHGEQWTRAVAQVPRHLFVPTFYEQDGTGRWSEVTTATPGYRENVYANRALTTQIKDNEPTSSSSEPGLMLSMLDALGAQAGQRVLEIGTGTGYNAALLSHVLGDANVTTVDVDPELTGDAARRLADAGYRPSVHTGDGARGVPSHAPFDRIIATCGMQSVPAAWVQQAADGAVMVVPVGWGLARITIDGGNATGRFLPQSAYFMARRTSRVRPRFDELEKEQPTVSDISAQETLTRLEFPLALALPGYRTCTWAGDDGGTASVGIWTPDGSAATAGRDGSVRQTGPRRLWDVVEQLSRQFETEPQREDFGLTITPERQWAWWKTDETGWDLPAVHFAE
ncbi:methyltransferase domain-containing protein [Kitasatospora sp. NPDC127111]|uniref:methyltransferase domain-containing protein n=1 Tax=Kitasatospora sp. NPDC127111 TaxID=3345363 RepID=UPI003641884B